MRTRRRADRQPRRHDRRHGVQPDARTVRDARNELRDRHARSRARGALRPHHAPARRRAARGAGAAGVNERPAVLPGESRRGGEGAGKPPCGSIRIAISMPPSSTPTATPSRTRRARPACRAS
ncbi:hypothetical protein BDI4_730004 [Burkholderia diffusa]|nr:hypothetical protein BDI4_730004 [Burkholderia diffusa]